MGTHPSATTVGYVLQDVGLFPHMTIAAERCGGASLEQWPGDRSRRRVANCSNLVRAASR
jgi:ABC-type proline/glycine betaine transport system ATPase subunit